MIRRIQILILTLFSFAGFSQKNTPALEFVENKGQWDPSVTFRGSLGSGAFFLQQKGFTVVQHHPDDLNKLAKHGHPEKSSGSSGGGKGNKATASKAPAGSPSEAGADVANQMLRAHAYRMELEGMNSNPKIIPDKVAPGVVSYFLGNDPSRFGSNCRVYSTVTYKDVYPNIDLRYYTDEGFLKYEFIVHPGGNPARIVMKYDGVDKLSLSKGELVIKTSVGEVRELPPYTYQSGSKGRTEIPSGYAIRGNKVFFQIDSYDKSVPLIIDPTLIFATFSGSRSDNWGFTATYGPDGSLYSGGIVFEAGFRVSPGAYQTSSGGGQFDMGIMKFDPTGTQRVYATYIGGSSSEQPHSLIVDGQGELVIAGRTNSSDYPSFQSYGPQGGFDIVLTKLNASGTGLVGSVRIGGTGSDGVNTSESRDGPTRLLMNFYGDDARSEVNLDRAGNIYLAACTRSADFFTTANAPYKTFGGGQDAVLIKMNSNLSAMLASTYLGGKAFDAGFVLDIHPFTQEIWVCGATLSDDFPGDKTNTIRSAFTGSQPDGFIAIFSNDGSIHRKSTYIGTDQRDAVLGVDFDRDGDPYIMGITYGNWPRVNAAYGTDGAKQYIGKLRPDLSGWQYTTTYGPRSSSPNISPVAFLVDRCQNVYVSGWGGTNLQNFDMVGTLGMPVTNDAIRRNTDNNDFYFIVIKKDATDLLYGSFFGQDGDYTEHVDGGTSRFDQEGVIYQAMCANCYSGGPDGNRPTFPVTPGAWCCPTRVSGADGSGSGAECNLAALKIAFNFAGVGAGVTAAIGGNFDTSGCVPLTVSLRDTVRNAQSYEWNFGDGSPDLITTNFDVQHTYTRIGDFQVRLIAVDSNSCNIRDTAYITMRVRADEALLDFNAVKLDPCESLSFRFDNLSTAPPGKPFTDTSFLWDFGDGTRLIAGPGPVTHNYQAAGTYRISLTVRDTMYCNVGDPVTKEYNLAPLVVARFELPNGCAPYTAAIQNTSIAGQTYLWDFGDGTTSTDKTPVKVYPNPGTYLVTLTVTDPNTCNITDQTTRTVLVQGAPTAAFTHSPVTPIENTPTNFQNNSSADAIAFIWSFGDGETLNTGSRLPIDHQYNSTGQFEACLVAVNQSGCADTVCAPVEALISPRVDVPNAFTPQGQAPNNIISVRGFGIGRMRMMIFNRLGQKVFETNSTKLGWDGRFNGVVQPMDVYAYVLDVEFTDGTRTTKKGDITLIR